MRLTEMGHPAAHMCWMISITCMQLPKQVLLAGLLMSLRRRSTERDPRGSGVGLAILAGWVGTAGCRSPD